MKTIILKVVEFAKVILPFFVKTNKKDSKEFSDLIKGQHEFLETQLTANTLLSHESFYLRLCI